MGDLGKFQAAVERSADTLMQELGRKAKTHADVLAGMTRAMTPVGIENGGRTRESIQSFVERDKDTITGGVKSDYPVAVFLEFGTGPVAEETGYPGDIQVSHVAEGWWWYSGEAGQRIKAARHGGEPKDYSLFTYTRGQPPKAMFYNAIQAYGDEIAKDFGDTALEVLRDE